jgi:putative transposase
MAKKKLRKDRHTVSISMEHLVFSPKYRGKVLVGDVGHRAEEVIREICEDMGLKVIELAVNVDHVHIFFQYPPKYSKSYIARRIKGRSSRILRQEFPHLVKWNKKGLWAPSCFHGSVGQGMDVMETYISSQKPDWGKRPKLKESGKRPKKDPYAPEKKKK